MPGSQENSPAAKIKAMKISSFLIFLCHIYFKILCILSVTLSVLHNHIPTTLTINVFGGFKPSPDIPYTHRRVKIVFSPSPLSRSG